MKCPYCEKEYKTQKGLDNHLLKCKIKQRLDVYNVNPLLKYNFTWFYKNYLPFANKKVKDSQLPLFYCKSRYFDKLLKLSELEIALELYSPEDYFNYLSSNKINFYDWDKEVHLLNFLYEWSYNEPLDHAIYRSEKYLKEHNWTLETINSEDLFLALRYGKISYKYIKEKKFDYEKKLLCDLDELRFLKYFLRG